MTGLPGGCVMCGSLYLRFNGQLPCWDHVGEGHVLRSVTREELESASGESLVAFPALLHIRSSFAAGLLPYPDDCRRCAMLGHLDDHVGASPATLRVLHVEPSFSCRLSCPLCIPAPERKRRMPPPHNLDPSLFEAFLRRLRADGVSAVRYLLFEGRGDPLMNPAVGRMVAAAKDAFPGVLTNVVSHGSYAWQPWLVSCGLDILTLSVDGARPGSYGRYRVGGDLDEALALMRRACGEGARARPPLRVVWRYILFEWNDGDDELAEAGALAASFGAEIRFLRTHSDGRSRRFPDEASLSSALRRLGLEGAGQSTFELKSREGTRSSLDLVEAEHVAALLAAARAACRRSDEASANVLVREALARDPGLRWEGDAASAGGLIRTRIDEISGSVRFPSTASGLAAICRDEGDGGSAERLLDRYLALAPGAPDASRIVAERHLKRAMEAARRNDEDEAGLEVRRALERDPGLAIAPGARRPRDLVRTHLADILARGPAPSTLCALAHLSDRHLRDGASARVLYDAYLRVAGDAPNCSAVEDRVRRLGPFGAVRGLARRAVRRLAAIARHRGLAPGPQRFGSRA